MDNLLDESVDPELQNAIKEYCCSSKYSKSTKTEKYQVLSTDQIVEYVVDYVQEVNNVVQLAPTVTRMLLSHCKWDKILIMEKFYNDPDKLFHEAHVINPFNISNHSNPESETNECEICLGELSSTSTATNACGHKFCTSCWSEYLKVKIMDEGVGNSILCAATDCDVIIDDETVIELVDDPQAKSRYQHLITNSFVQQNLLLRWCPAPGCSFAIKVDYRPFKPMVCNCKCGHEFCFDCGDQWHGPVSCDLLKRFNVHIKQGIFNPVMPTDKDLGYDDKIKTCPNPNCTVSIQKIFGCHAMHCTNCSTIFCWICMKSFKNKAGVYQHACKGETTPEDEYASKSTETKKNDLDENELSPPHKLVKISWNKPGVSSEKLGQSESSNEEERLLPQKVVGDQQQNNQIEVFRLERAAKHREMKRKNRGQENELTQHVVEEDKLPTFVVVPDRSAVAVAPHRSAVAVAPHRSAVAVIPHRQFDREDNRIFRQNQAGQDDRWLNLFAHQIRNVGMRIPPPMRHAHLNPYRYRTRAITYYHKYNTEDAYFKTASTLSVRIKQALQLLEEATPNLTQLELASVLLARSRQTLKYSAIFAMYLKKVDATLIFENLYRDLEDATGELSGSMAYVDIAMKDTHPQIPDSIVPAHRNCKLRLQALLDYIDDGYDNEWWVFLELPV